MAGRLHLARRPQPPPSLVQLGAYLLPPLLDAILVNLVILIGHADAYACSRCPGIPPSQSVTPTDCDSLGSEGVLSAVKECQDQTS